MLRSWVWTALVLASLVVTIVAYKALPVRLDLINRNEKAIVTVKTNPVSGTIVGHTDYTGISGKIYRVPVIADGQGGEVRWMKDVLWADLPIEERLGFAMRGGGLLGAEDMKELWLDFGEWRKVGKYYQLLIGDLVPKGE